MKKYLAFLFLVISMTNFCMVQTAAAMRESTKEQLNVIRSMLTAPPTEEERTWLRDGRERQARLELLRQSQRQLGVQADEMREHRQALINQRAALAFGYASPDAGQNRDEVIARMQREIESMQEEENKLRETIVQIDQWFQV